MDISTKTAEKQIYENIEVIPIIGDTTNNQDLMDLKTGLEMGLVTVKECIPETVNTVIVANNAVKPLIIFDGEQIEGAKQNRIINQTIIIAQNTEMEVPVSCTEKGRWSYKSEEFKHSNYFADVDIRKSKRSAVHNKIDPQREVWNSISSRQSRMEVCSVTSAMSDTYNATKEEINEYSDNFDLLENQIGAIVFINNKFEAIEILNNPEIYGRYHNMILNSYIVDAVSRKDEIKNDNETLDEVLDDISNLELEEVNSVGIEKIYNASGENILGTIANYEDDLIHATYFKKGSEDRMSRFAGF